MDYEVELRMNPQNFEIIYLADGRCRHEISVRPGGRSIDRQIRRSKSGAMFAIHNGTWHPVHFSIPNDYSSVYILEGKGLQNMEMRVTVATAGVVNGNGNMYTEDCLLKAAKAPGFRATKDEAGTLKLEYLGGPGRADYDGKHLAMTHNIQGWRAFEYELCSDQCCDCKDCPHPSHARVDLSSMVGVGLQMRLMYLCKAHFEALCKEQEVMMDRAIEAFTKQIHCSISVAPTTELVVAGLHVEKLDD